MERTSKFWVTLLVFIVILSNASFVLAQSSAITDANTQISQAYLAILDASHAGGETSRLIEQLNYALNLTSQAQELEVANPEQAGVLALEARQVALNVTQQATLVEHSALGAFPVVEVSLAVALVAVGVVVFFLGPKLFWGLWFRLRRNYRVGLKKVNGAGNSLVVTAEQLCAVILAVTVILALVSVSGFLFSVNSGEQFSELGVLGPNMMLGDYPSRVVVGETINLYGYVGNHMGEPMLYTFMVKLGDNETVVNPASALSPFQQYRQVVANNQSWVFPMEMSLSKEGINQRIIFELWSFNQTINQNQYLQWGQLMVNVTAPAR